ncbi:hypothetical protein [Actinomadura sp. WMMB 499]|uniref:hypothetical protein n=1 Tax=Actinomadura sp. WMMB 499 TaxID=1219491 RepID=UPI00124700D3|nr:hypothetical protein [Actinomadura sp. WMMB 499]QFG22889.1 hypothetical protein F7P10_18990 [Actinomadura sp. WMMB 499]
MVVDFLCNRSGPREVVLSRPDAWQLLGFDAGALREDVIPGLVLTEDDEQTRNYLLSQGPPHRLLVTYRDAKDVLNQLPACEQERLAALSLRSSAESALEIAETGETNNDHRIGRGAIVPTSLHLMTRPSAFDQLTAMPTLVRRV